MDSTIQCMSAYSNCLAVFNETTPAATTERAKKAYDRGNATIQEFLMITAFTAGGNDIALKRKMGPLVTKVKQQPAVQANIHSVLWAQATAVTTTATPISAG
eukprot:4019253-Pyramimonas_sp.AAC.1